VIGVTRFPIIKPHLIPDFLDRHYNTIRSYGVAFLREHLRRCNLPVAVKEEAPEEDFSLTFSLSSPSALAPYSWRYGRPEAPLHYCCAPLLVQALPQWINEDGTLNAAVQIDAHIHLAEHAKRGTVVARQQQQQQQQTKPSSSSPPWPEESSTSPSWHEQTGTTGLYRPLDWRPMNELTEAQRERVKFGLVSSYPRHPPGWDASPPKRGRSLSRKRSSNEALDLTRGRSSTRELRQVRLPPKDPSPPPKSTKLTRRQLLQQQVKDQQNQIRQLQSQLRQPSSMSIDVSRLPAVTMPPPQLEAAKPEMSHVPSGHAVEAPTLGLRFAMPENPPSANGEANFPPPLHQPPPTAMDSTMPPPTPPTTQTSLMSLPPIPRS
jgi:hypothetical protein